MLDAQLVKKNSGFSDFLELNLSTKTGIVLAIIGAITIIIGISVFSQAFSGLEDSVDDIDCSDAANYEQTETPCDTEGDFGLGACFGGLIISGIGIGILVSALVSLVAGGVSGSSAVTISNVISIECPHCNSTIEIQSNASGLFDCQHCNEEFQWN